MVIATASRPTRAESAQELQRRRQARDRLIPFARYTMPEYEPAAHLQVLAQKLEAVECGEIKRLMVITPPRHGKSELVSIRFPTWAMGRDPTRLIVQSAYAESLALKHSREARDVFVSSEFHKLFPGIHHRPQHPDQERIPAPMQQAHEWGTVQGGLYYAVGVGGGLTGRGFHIGIIDDPIKDAEEAESITYRDRVWRWYTSVFRPRAEPNAAIILCMARWNEDDVAGRLIRQMKEDPNADQWIILHMPALSPEGEALWAARFSVQDLLATKASSDPYTWGALWQGSPSPERGNILLKEWWKRYDALPPHLDDMIQSWDMTFKEAGTSMVVGQVWGKLGANKYLIDQVRAKMDFPDTMEAFREMNREWPQAVAKLVEDAANGPAIIAMLKNEIPGIIAIPPRGSKTARARAASPEARAGNVWLPEGPMGDDFIEEAAVFPHGLFDDQVDAFSQAMAYWQQLAAEGEEKVVEYHDPVTISTI